MKVLFLSKVFRARTVAAGLVMALLASATQSDAAIVGASGVPIGWRLQNYVPGGFSLWYTPATCPTGHLVFPSSATSGDIDKLWSLVLTAKGLNRPITIDYDNTTCEIRDYYMDS